MNCKIMKVNLFDPPSRIGRSKGPQDVKITEFEAGIAFRAFFYTSVFVPTEIITFQV